MQGHGMQPPTQMSGSPQQQTIGGQQQQMAQGPHAQSQLLQPVRVKELAESDVVTAEPDTPITDVIAKMAEEDVGSVIIVDDDRPVGILTDRKIALALRDKEKITDLKTSDLIKDRELITATTEVTALEAVEQLSEENIRRLPIVDEDGQLKGIVTLDDLLVMFGTALYKATEVIKAQSPRL